MKQIQPLCAGLLTPHKVLTEGLPARRVALIQGDLRSADGAGQETRAQRCKRSPRHPWFELKETQRPYHGQKTTEKT